MPTIKSKNNLFLEMEIEKPKLATHIINVEGDEIYKCPHCGNCATADECDVIGAEPNCLFCNKCNREFSV